MSISNNTYNTGFLGGEKFGIWGLAGINITRSHWRLNLNNLICQTWCRPDAQSDCAMAYSPYRQNGDLSENR